ncbi:dihydrodipicolinate synthetase family protein [Klebsiella pneumoniae]|uniref:Dihydrodipicolinate synthetase family protein n=1 Tax=Klebsiella pneumoniae TaxID=573 RepID=A0A377TMA1_KLEPN|nr:dihydrodipicolinate synthetase family protein [Klebsiella pneumoniae]
MKALDLRGIVPAPVTPFTRDGRIDHKAIKRLGSWLGSVKGVKGLVVLGHAGEGTFLTQQEQADVIRSFVDSTDGRVPVIAGITGEGTEVAALEAQRAVEAGPPQVCYILHTVGCVLATKKGRLRIVIAWYMKRVDCLLFFSSIRMSLKPLITLKRCWIFPRNRGSLR